MGKVQITKNKETKRTKTKTKCGGEELLSRKQLIGLLKGMTGLCLRPPAIYMYVSGIVFSRIEDLPVPATGQYNIQYSHVTKRLL